MTAVNVQSPYIVVVQRVRVLLVVTIHFRAVAVISNESITHAYPDVSPGILRQSLDLLMGKSLRTREMGKAVVAACQGGGKSQKQQQKAQGP